MPTLTSRRTAALVLVAAALVVAALLALGVGERGASAQAGRPMSLEVFLRRFYGLPGSVKVAIGQAKPGPVAGLETVPVTVGEGSRNQTLEVVRSTDGRYVGLAPLIDTRRDPFARVAAAIDLEARPSRGPADAEVTIVEYSDFQCPYCRRMAPVVDQTMRGPFGKQVRWVYKHFPLRTIHPWAEPAGIAAECARRIGGDDAFWKLHDHYFEQQEKFTAENHRERVLAWAKTQRLPAARLESCLDSPSARQTVQADLAEGQSLGVGSTPTLVINGRVSPGYRSAEELASLIEQEIAYQRERRRAAGE